MIKALISQRQELNQYDDRIDSMEVSYVKYFAALGITVYPVPNVVKNAESMLQDHWDLMILTGGGILSTKYYHHKVLGYKQDELNITLRRSRLSGVARATVPDEQSHLCLF